MKYFLFQRKPIPTLLLQNSLCDNGINNNFKWLIVLVNIWLIIGNSNFYIFFKITNLAPPIIFELLRHRREWIKITHKHHGYFSLKGLIMTACTLYTIRKSSISHWIWIRHPWVVSKPMNGVHRKGWETFDLGQFVRILAIFHFSILWNCLQLQLSSQKKQVPYLQTSSIFHTAVYPHTLWPPFIWRYSNSEVVFYPWGNSSEY